MVIAHEVLKKLNLIGGRALGAFKPLAAKARVADQNVEIPSRSKSATAYHGRESAREISDC